MPEATEVHRNRPPANKAPGPQDAASGNMPASEVKSNSTTSEPIRITNALKARKRTKTGCLSKSSRVTDRMSIQITHISQHAASVASSVARSARPAKTVSSRSANAKAISPESFSRTLWVLSGQVSQESLRALNILPIPMELQASMGVCLQHRWTLRLRRGSFPMESRLG